MSTLRQLEGSFNSGAGKLALTTQRATRLIRVLHVSYSLGMGGLEVFVRDLLSRLDRTRFAPSVCAFSSGGALVPDFERLGIPVYSLGASGGDGIRLIRRLRELMRELAVDIVHSHNLDPWCHAGLAALWARRTRVVHTEHSYKQHYTSGRWVMAGRLLGRFSDRVIADSQDVAAFLRHRIGVPVSRLRVVYNGVDPDRFAAARSTGGARALRGKLGLGVTDPVACIVARLVPVKNHALLLRAFRRVAAEAPRSHLIIVGDGPLRAHLEALTGELGLTGRVSFMGERQDIPEIMAASDIFVLSSLSEGCSMTLLEAMAARLPVVCTRVGGNAELVEDGTTGFVVPSQEPEVMAGAIVRLLTDAGLRAQFGTAGIARVRRCFDLAHTARQYEDTYAEVLARSNRR